jgi:beta-lactamase regulating signal transducer with metallopeptidase domain
MSDFWQIASSWPVRAAVVGGGVLLAGRVLILLTRQPARRSAVGMATVAVALLAIPLTVLPGWLPVTLPARTPEPEAVAQLPLPSKNVEADRPSAPRRELVHTTAPQADRTGPEHSTPPADSAVAVAVPSQSEPATNSASDADSVRRFLYVTYAVISFGLLARLVIGHFGLMRIWRRAARPPEWAERTFREMAAGLSPRAQLRVSHRPAGPVCFGLVRPRVLIPQSLIDTGDHAALRCVFAHELGHLRRRDPFAGWLLGLTRAAYFVWPWLAGLRREVRLAQEYLADREAVRHASGPADYAELLIRMTRARPAPLGAAGARGPSSELYRRVTMLLRNKEHVETRCPRRWKVAIAGGLTALAVGAAGIYIQPRPAVAGQPEKKEAPKPAPAPKGDAIKELIEKLKKDVGDDPDKKKQLEDLQKQLTPKPADPENPSHAPVPFPPPGIAIPQIFDPDIPEDALLQELLKGQDDMLKQLQQLLGQVQGGRGFAFQMGPDGTFRQLGVGMPRGGRLGVRVEKPSDVLASQLDLPNGQGLVCVDVPADSTAGKIGIKPHDILLEVAGKPVSNDVQRFVTALKDIKPDTAIDIVVLRKGKKETIKGAKLPEAKEVADAPNPFGGIPNLEAIPVPLDLPPAPRVPGVSRVPAPPVIPVPPGRGIGAVAGPGETVRVEQVNDAFTLFYSKNGVKVTITGSKEANNPAKAESIEVDDNGKTTKAESIDKLPKEYQDLAKSAMKAIK